jgi:predicted transcriptional regulator
VPAIFDSESEPFSVEYIFKRTSDEKALTLFKSIAHSEADSYALLKANLTRKQYYVRISGLIDAGLIKRYKGKYSLTSLGRVVYGSLMTISNALDHQPKLVSEISRSPR